MTESIASTLAKADEELVKEILREAEIRLEAQLSAAIAADQRAMTFLGFLLALVAFLIGSAIAALTAETPSSDIAVLASLAAIGFSISGVYAFIATRPVKFEFVGNDPDAWLEDATKGTSLHVALAEQCEHYDEMLKDNRDAMVRSSTALKESSYAAAGTVVIVALVAIKTLLAG